MPPTKNRKKNKLDDVLAAAALEKELADMILSKDQFGADVAEKIRKQDNSWIPHKGLRAIQESFENISDRQVDQILQDIARGRREVPVQYEDGDQSPLSGDKASILRCNWSSGMDYGLHTPQFRHFSPALIACYMGNLTIFNKTVESMSEEALKLALTKRETLLLVGPLFHCIKGARDLFPGSPVMSMTIRNHGRPEMKQLQIFERLLELGAEVNVHDFAGYTPLHHCLTSAGNSTTFSMAKLLLKHGADVNAVNRFGDTALMEPIMGHKLDYIKLLVENGADPFIKNTDGVTARQTGSYFPAVLRILKLADKRKINVERVRAKEEEDYKKCTLCKQPAKYKCTGCFLMWYCSAECQKANWEEHKDPCKEKKAEYKEVKIVKGSLNFNYQTGKMAEMGGMKKSAPSNSIVKIQVSLGGNAADAHFMMIYNKDRSINGLISSKESEFGAQLEELIRSKGFQGEKGFFYAIKTKTKVAVNPTMLPPETW